jgi:fructose-bisphosphate aldolase, class II
MALISLRQILDQGAEHGYRMPAFKISNLECLRAVMQAVARTGSPAIVQVSQADRSYAGDAFLRQLFIAAQDEFPNVPPCILQDHGTSPAVCRIPMEIGFTSVMMDGSLLDDGKPPASYEHSLKVSAEAVDIAHARGVSVEGELGVLGSLDTGAGEQEDGHGFAATRLSGCVKPI